MDLKTVISDSSRTSKIPTVITDEVFTVNFYNDAAKKLIPGLSVGHGFDEYVTIYDKSELKRSKYPCSMLIGCGEMKYPGVFCPVTAGFAKECVFSIAAGTEGDDCEQYLTMKLAVISKCLAGKGSGAPAGKERAYGRMYSSYEANARMLAAMSEEEAFSAINIKQLLSEVFDYYAAIKYGAESTKRFDIQTDEDYVKIKNALCIVLVFLYDLCQTISRNSFCNISVKSGKDGATFLFTVRPKHKLASLVKECGETEEAVYTLLGRGAENILLIKTLARRMRGQADMEYDTDSDELRFCVAAPFDNKDVVKAGGGQLAETARIAADVCLSGVT